MQISVINPKLYSIMLMHDIKAKILHIGGIILYLVYYRPFDQQDFH